MCVHRLMHKHTYVHMCGYGYMCTYTYVCMYCVCVHIYICVYMYIHMIWYVYVTSRNQCSVSEARLIHLVWLCPIASILLSINNYFVKKFWCVCKIKFYLLTSLLLDSTTELLGTMLQRIWFDIQAPLYHTKSEFKSISQVEVLSHNWYLILLLLRNIPADIHSP